MVYKRKNPIPPEHQAIIYAIGKKVHDLRKATDLSIERYCVKYDIPRISYSNLESGNNFHMSTLLKVISSHPEIKSLNQFFDGIKLSD